MLRKIVLFCIAITLTDAISVEVRSKNSKQSILIEYNQSDKLSDLRRKLQEKNFIRIANDDKWGFVNEANDEVLHSLESMITIDQFKNAENFIIIVNHDEEINAVKVCFTRDLNECKDVNIDIECSLSELREALNNQNLLPNPRSKTENDCYDWRFISSRASETEAKAKHSFSSPNLIFDPIRSEADVPISRALFRKTYVHVVNFNEINLEEIWIVQGLEEEDVRINLLINLLRLRQILSKKLVCPALSWMAPSTPLLTEDEKNKWRVINRNIDTAHVSMAVREGEVAPDLLVGTLDEVTSTVNSKMHIGQDGRKRIDYSNTVSDKVEFVGMRCRLFLPRGNDKIWIAIRKKHQHEDKLDPIMMANVRSVTQKNVAWENVLIAENNTAVALRIEHTDGQPLIVTIKSDHETIIDQLKGTYFDVFSESKNDIVLSQSVIDSPDELKIKQQAITVNIKPLIRWENKDGRQRWPSSKRRRREQPYNMRMHQDALNFARFKEGAHNDITFGRYWNEVTDGEFNVVFYLFNFRDRVTAEKIIGLQPTGIF